MTSSTFRRNHHHMNGVIPILVLPGNGSTKGLSYISSQYIYIFSHGKIIGQCFDDHQHIPYGDPFFQKPL